MKLGRLAWRLLPVETGMQALHVSWLVDLAADSGLQVIVWGTKGHQKAEIIRNPRTQAFPGKSTDFIFPGVACLSCVYPLCWLFVAVCLANVQYVMCEEEYKPKFISLPTPNFEHAT